MRCAQVKIPAENLIPGADSFANTNEFLCNSRAWVACACHRAKAPGGWAHTKHRATLRKDQQNAKDRPERIWPVFARSPGCCGTLLGYVYVCNLVIQRFTGFCHVHGTLHIGWHRNQWHGMFDLAVREFIEA